MFRKKPQQISSVLGQFLKQEGLATPLHEQHDLNSWEEIAGSAVARYTIEKYIRNQTLYVKISSPALRTDLSMMRAEFIKRINDSVGCRLISDVRFY